MKRIKLAEHISDPQATCRLAASTGEAVEIVDEAGNVKWRVTVPPADVRQPWRDSRGHWTVFTNDLKKHQFIVDGLDYPIHVVDENHNRVMTMCGVPRVPDDHDDCFKATREAVDIIGSLLDSLPRCSYRDCDGVWCQEIATMRCVDATGVDDLRCEKHSYTGGMLDDEEPTPAKWKSSVDKAKTLFARIVDNAL